MSHLMFFHCLGLCHIDLQLDTKEVDNVQYDLLVLAKFYAFKLSYCSHKNTCKSTFFQHKQKPSLRPTTS